MSMQEKILKKAQGRMEAMGMARRPDLMLVDHAPVGDGKTTCHVLIAHSKELGAPNTREVEDYFHTLFGERVRPNLSTICAHGDQNVVTVVAQTQSITRPIEDAAMLTRVTPDMYTDASTNEIWDVVRNEEGRMYMIRHSDENLSDIVETRRTTARRHVARLSNLKVGFIQCDKGDHVQFFDHGVVAYGEVTSCGEKVTVRSVGGGAVTVGREAILKITQKSQSAISDEKNELRDYFEKAYGDKQFADELVRTTVKEEAGGKTGV